MILDFKLIELKLIVTNNRTKNFQAEALNLAVGTSIQDMIGDGEGVSLLVEVKRMTHTSPLHYTRQR